MEFQSYPTAVPTGRKDVRTLLRLQNMLHSTDSIVLPVTMLLIASSLVAYQHCTHPDTSRTSVRNFLIKIVVSMMPLGILEIKVPKCSDPVGLFARFSTKVVMMHIAFLALRCGSCFWGLSEDDHYRFNATMLTAACVLLPTIFGFRPTPRGIWEHRDVLLLVAACMAVGVWEVETFTWMTYGSHWMRRQYLAEVISAASDYIEIIAFVPAVWMAFRRGCDAGEQDMARVSVSQKRALSLFAFMAVFYSQEDISSAMAAWQDVKIAAFGHLVHYLLILDFAGFLLAHLCDPEKLQAMRGSFMSWVADCCAV